MKTLIKIIFIILFAFISSLVSCGNGNSKSDDDNSALDNVGVPAHYDFNVKDGEFAGHYTGDISFEREASDILVSSSMYKTTTNGAKYFTLLLFGDEVTISEKFFLNNGSISPLNQAPEGESSAAKTVLSIDIHQTEDSKVHFKAASGSLDISNTHLGKQKNGVNYAAYKLTFSGSFEYGKNDSKSTEISGSLTVNPPAGAQE